MSKVLEALTLLRGQKWFTSTDRNAEDGWNGPHKSIEEAVRNEWMDFDNPIIYVAKGHKMKKEEKEEFGVDYDWFVETQEALKIDLSSIMNFWEQVKKLENKPCCNPEKGEWTCPA